MLDFFNKKYETKPDVLPPESKPEPSITPSISPSITPSISPSLVDIDISGPAIPKQSDDTTGMEIQWGLTSSSSSDEEEKTQISNQAEKPLAAGNQINLELSTDDEVGLTELDTDADNDQVSILPDASQSTFADHEDRNDFLKSEMPQDIGNLYGNC